MKGKGSIHFQKKIFFLFIFILAVSCSSRSSRKDNTPAEKNTQSERITQPRATSPSNANKKPKAAKKPEMTPKPKAMKKPETTVQPKSASQYEISKWVNKFDSTFYNTKNLGSYKRYEVYAKSKNAYYFMALAYGVNALNIMNETTNDTKYLEANSKLVQNIIDLSVQIPLKWKYKTKTSSPTAIGSMEYKGWKVHSKNVGKRVNGRDWMLYEGRLYRYVMQYLYILKKRHVTEDHPEFLPVYNKILTYVETNIWDKWQKRSLAKNGDYSMFYAQRIHMGSHWAEIALYLKELTADPNRKKVCEQVIKGYDQLLKNNFKTKTKNGQSYYIWNSTYDMLPGKTKGKSYMTKEKNAIVQDVPHGNQVVDYVITAYKLNNQDWTKGDIKKLCNTVLLSTWDNAKKGFNDRVISSAKSSGILKDTGFKQADGWVKLAQYDANLLKDYEAFYNKNKSKIDSRHLNVQFYAQMARNYQMLEAN